MCKDDDHIYVPETPFFHPVALDILPSRAFYFLLVSYA